MCELSQLFVERHSLQSCVMLLQSTRGQCGTEFQAAGYEAEADGVCGVYQDVLTGAAQTVSVAAHFSLIFKGCLNVSLFLSSFFLQLYPVNTRPENNIVVMGDNKCIIIVLLIMNSTEKEYVNKENMSVDT